MVPESLRAARSGLHIALFFCIPLSLWLLGQSWLIALGQASRTGALQSLLPSLAILQLGGLALCTPGLLRYHRVQDQLYGLLMLLFTPLPLYSIAWATGVVHAPVIVGTCLFMVAMALGFYVYYRLVISLLPSGQFRGLPVLASQWALCILVWHYRATWLEWVGL